MNIAAYCRVSTDKSDQLNSLEAQKEFFSEYTKRTGDTLVRLYADEGISGTKIKNRKEFLRMMSDAEHGLFDMVVVKDISRFARNTVDLLQSVRKLKALGIETQFLTANMTSMGNSEFVLTIFGALAQEESANTSKRVKFGKKMNAEKGRVPNIVYGYDKTIGDYFNLAINQEEAKVVKQIYQWYTQEGYGAAKISNMLNEKGYKTKRNCKWSQNAICRILTRSPPARSRSSSTGRTAASATAKAATTYHPKAPAAAGAFPYPALQNPETPKGTGQPIAARPLPDRPGKQRGVSSTSDRSQKLSFCDLFYSFFYYFCI